MLKPGGDLDTLRLAVREWCAATVPADWRTRLAGADREEMTEFLVWWGTELREAGLMAPHLPAEWGGGFSIEEQVVIAEELARGGGPRNMVYQVAVFNVAPTVLHSGTPEQRERFLGGIVRGESWCQGFSEPDAGSDLASLRTRAVRDGDNYVVNGQKVWTSFALTSDWCMLLVRTDPDAPKHRGISCLAVSMDTPGITAQPIRQATGATDFCEVFLEDVVVPASNLIGAENDGWRVAQGTLAAERAITVLEMSERLQRNGIEEAISRAASQVLEDGTAVVDDAVVRSRLAECFAESKVLGHLLSSMIDDVIDGVDVGATAAVIKVFYTELLHKFMRYQVELGGLDAQVDRPALECNGWETGFWMRDYLHSFSWHISGGTSEIMRNVIGERLLGLPR